MRDNQRARVYNAESCIPFGKKYESVGECQAYVDELLRLPQVRYYWNGYSSIRVHDGRGGRRARAGWGKVFLPKWARNESTILHEVAHVLSPSGVKHGPEFCRNMIRLVDIVIGHDAALVLEGTYKGKGCTVAPEDKPITGLMAATAPPPPVEFSWNGKTYHVHESKQSSSPPGWPEVRRCEADGRCRRCPPLAGGPREAAAKVKP